jgi:hypothetical protein
MHSVTEMLSFLGVKLGVTHNNSHYLKGLKDVIVKVPINVAAEIQTIVHRQINKNSKNWHKISL